ncbi:MAG: hypothetical protein A2064_10720 [Spirochaetes bacterium GWB1_66_5]|nr:MAG: hypothetical protein A2064_10720 [Spirochaetes bacterium GWB1_66_5]
MRGSAWPAMLFLAAIGVLSPASARADWVRGPALAVGVSAGAGAAKSPYWPAKAQSWLSTRLLVEAPLAAFLGLGFSLGYHLVDDSNTAAGFLYRGYNGLEAGTCLLLRSRLAPDRPRGGIAVGGSASFDVYNRTELLFFYPSLTAEPYLELPSEGPPRHTFGLGLPCRLDFRRDMELSASIGLGVRWRWYPKWKLEGA